VEHYPLYHRTSEGAVGKVQEKFVASLQFRLQTVGEHPLDNDKETEIMQAETDLCQCGHEDCQHEVNFAFLKRNATA
jgi:hypothetical protein